MQLIQSEQVDLALAGKPNNLPTGLEFYKIDDISLFINCPTSRLFSHTIITGRTHQLAANAFYFAIDGMARQRIEQWLRSKHIKHPQIYATVAGHEGIVPMVALGFGLAMLPDVVIDNNPMSKDVSRLNLDNPVEAFDLGFVCKRNLANPLIRAFWEMLD